MTTIPTEVSLRDVLGKDTGGELPVSDEALREEALAEAMAEPFIPKNTQRNKFYPTGGYGPLVKGECLIACSPARRKARVMAVGKDSAVVQCSVWTNVPELVPMRDQPKFLTLKDHFQKLFWNETWAVREFEYVDPRDNRKRWMIKHCVVIEDNRSERDRSGSCSIYDPKRDGGNPHPVIVVRDPNPDDDDKPMPDEATTDIQNIRQIPGLGKLHAARDLAERMRIDVTDLKGPGTADAILKRIEESIHAENTERQEADAG